MTHPIYVCIPHKLTMHTARNLGIHCKHKHGMDSIQAERQGIVIHIGECDPQTIWLRRCPSPHNKPATERELKEAERRLANRNITERRICYNCKEETDQYHEDDKWICKQCGHAFYPEDERK